MSRGTAAWTVLTFIWSGAVAADPMRPLAAAPSSSSAAAAPGASRLGATISASAAGEVTSAAPALLAIRSDATGQRQALFGERWLAAGAQLNAQTRIGTIEGNRVELRTGKVVRSLHLLPPLLASSGGGESSATPAARTNTPPTPGTARRGTTLAQASPAPPRAIVPPTP